MIILDSAICFLTRDHSEDKLMKLVILCRTQGRDLAEFMFREGSNIAIHILDNIAVEAAGLALKELRVVAERLRKDYLWKLFSSPSFGSQQLNNSYELGVPEMLSLATVRPIQHLLGTCLVGSITEVARLLSPDSGIHWTVCCLAMMNDPIFTPHCSIDSEGYVSHLFYIREEDLFYLIVVDVRGRLLRSDLVERDDLVSTERRNLAIQKFTNFLLHFIWHSL